MKTRLVHLVVIVLTVSLTSCNKKTLENPLEVKDFTSSECKLKDGITKGDEEEYITLWTLDDNFILFNHINSVFNCDPGQISVSIIKSDNKIIIDEDESKSGLRCLCPYDIKCTMGPLEYGTYSVVFQKKGVIYQECSMVFNELTNIKIDI
jgi:hypothetical protein